MVVVDDESGPSMSDVVPPALEVPPGMVHPDDSETDLRTLEEVVESCLALQADLAELDQVEEQRSHHHGCHEA